MSRRIVECGRIEVKGAVVRFKQKGTLEASDRNLADLEKLFVRATPSPELRLFADFVFAGDVFRVWQDSTLVNYKDFLEKVELAGIGNFRAMLRHVTRADPERSLDATSRAFAEGRGNAERFVNKDELADYDRALARGDAAPGARRPARVSTAGGGTATPAPERETSRKRAAAEEAWAKLAPQLAAEEQADRGTQNLAPIAGATLLLVSLLTAGLVGRAYVYVRAEFTTVPSKLYVALALGALIALAFFLGGVLYLRRPAASRTKTAEP